MSTIFTILATVILTWAVTYEIFYSPKAQIKRLWKEILAVSLKIGEQRKYGYANDALTYECKKIIHKKEIIIGALLDYHFNPEEDQEYIDENRPENQK